jgi:putative transposase
MPRHRRGWLDGSCYHITHRCHERRFLLKFAKYRTAYVRRLGELRPRFGVSVLDYMVTSNHVHLLIHAVKGERISPALQFLHGQTAQAYNRTKDREGAFWSNRFHATRIQSGAHLGRCLFYIDLNMVRARVVEDPADWEHTAYHEFVGERKRNRIVDMPRLLKVLSMGNADLAGFRDWYLQTLATKLACIEHRREPYWTQALEAWLRSTAKRAGMRRCPIHDTEPGEAMYLYNRRIYPVKNDP